MCVCVCVTNACVNMLYLCQSVSVCSTVYRYKSVLIRFKSANTVQCAHTQANMSNVHTKSIHIQTYWTSLHTSTLQEKMWSEKEMDTLQLSHLC